MSGFWVIYNNDVDYEIDREFVETEDEINDTIVSKLHSGDWEIAPGEKITVERI